jgi:hypothetical protein
MDEDVSHRGDELPGNFRENAPGFRRKPAGGFADDFELAIYASYFSSFDLKSSNEIPSVNRRTALAASRMSAR